MPAQRKRKRKGTSPAEALVGSKVTASKAINEAEPKRIVWPRATTRSIMTHIATNYDRIKYYKEHGNQGSPIRGRFHEAVADWLIAHCDTSAWCVQAAQDKKKCLVKYIKSQLASYVRNAFVRGFDYAEQERNSANKELTKISKSYDWWDIGCVHSLFTGLNESKMDARTSSLSAVSITKNESQEVANHVQESPKEEAAAAPVSFPTPLPSPESAEAFRNLAAVVPISETTGSDVVATATVIRRGGILQNVMRTLEHDLLPTLATLRAKHGATPSALDLRHTAFQWILGNMPDARRFGAMSQVARNTSDGQAITFAVCSMIAAEAGKQDIIDTINHFMT